MLQSELKNGEYSPPLNLGPNINNEFHEADPFIAPDESYLIFARKDPEGFGGADLFISFRNEEGYIYWVSAKIIEELKHFADCV